MQLKSVMGIEIKVEEHEHGYRSYYNSQDIPLLDTRYVGIDEMKAVLFLEGLAKQLEVDNE